ncbi:MAG: hypothetical protein QNK04_12735, partial [Myxococcota bacterium]|nr:hypothetical protein [Myxococcota bacterium]
MLAISTLLSAAPAAAQPATCPGALATADIIDHDFGASFCELCEIGTVQIEIQNPFEPGDDVDFSEIVVVEDLLASGLTYVPNTTTFTGLNVGAPAVVEPVVGGANGSVLTWTLDPAYVLPGLPGAPANRATLVVEFDVRRHPAVGEEGLVAANRNIDASVDFVPSCAPTERYGRSTGPGTLPLREPIPQIIKGGRNVDAGQGAGSYSDPVYGHENDDVIWRIEVRNNGLADLQDFQFTDSIVPGNFDIDFVCDNEADATAAAGGASPAGCVSYGGTRTTITDFDVRAAFGGAANPYVVAPAGGSGFYYLIGTVTDSCVNRVNTVSNVEWGCQSQPPTGGIAVTSTGVTPGDSALLSTRSVAAGVDVDVFLTGTTTSQNMGSRGQVRIRIRNQSGGTIKGEAAGLRIENLLPPEYVIDPTFTPTITMSPAYGNAYPGMIDTVQWTNPAAGTFPLVTTDPALPLSNTDLDFLLTSSTVHPDHADQVHMIRHGDVVNVRFQTVLIDPSYYDKTADIDVREEEPASSPPGTDPTESFSITNRAELWWNEFCTTTLHNRVENDTDTAEPEDLDVDIVGPELIFILTNSGDPLSLTAALTNRGGHDARDYQALVTFGDAMVVQTVAPGCAATTNPPPLPEWQIPTGLPATGSVYLCDRGRIRPGETENLTFEVVKNTAASFDD